MVFDHRALVAFTARFYYPVGDNRISRTQVYICGPDGSHRRQLTHENGDCGQVRWLDGHTLGYTVNMNHLKIPNLKTGGVRLFFATKGDEEITTEPVRTYPDSFRFPSFNSQHLTFDRKGVHAFRSEDGDDNSVPWTVRLARLKRMSQGSSSWWVMDILRAFAAQSRRFLTPFLPFTASSKTYMVSWTTDSTLGATYIVSRLSLGGVKKLIEGHELVVDPTKRFLAGVQHRDTAAYGPMKSVWTASAYLLDQQTGKTSMIVDGLAWATSISLSPLTR